MKTSSRLLIILAAIILFGTGVLTGASMDGKRLDIEPAGQTALPADKVAQTASVMIDTGAELLGFPNVAVNDGDTVWSVLENISSARAELPVEGEQYQDMGVLVKSIKGYANGSGDEYWQYWINNKYAQVAADKQAVKAGDVIMWKFTKAQFKEY